MLTTVTDLAAGEPVPPLIVAEGWDITFYSSAAAVDRYIEPWFASEEYRAFDSEGRRLELVIEAEQVRHRWRPSTMRERVRVRALEPEPNHARELADLLRAWLEIVGAPRPAVDTALKELLRLAIERGSLDP